MNFKRLDVYGFKSFADKLSVEFGEGITAIVGPNGCGKSNVADAIRWALGEQSAKTLRGSSMSDVIFSGTENRKSLSFCEVLLYFDNSSRMFNVEYDEVTVSRKLYKDGTSEYFINKQPCRLKDIQGILFNSGLGRDSYSIIGQGRIDEILSQKPDDRRAIFEDAAGISKYKQSKLEQERRLVRVGESLQITATTVAELERQLGPLKKQAEDAKKYFELKDRLRSLEISAYLYEYDASAEARAKHAGKIAGISDEIEQKQREYNEVCFTYSETLDSMNNADNTLAGLNNNLLEYTVTLEKQTGQFNLIENKIQYLSEQNQRLEGEIAKLIQEREVCTGLLSDTEKSKTVSFDNINVLKKKIDDYTSKYLSLMEVLTKNEGNVEDTNRRVIEAMDKLSVIKADLSKLTAEKEALIDRKADLVARVGTCSDILSQLKPEREHAEAELLAEDTAQKGLKQDGLEISDAYSACQNKLRETVTELDKVSQAYYSMTARKKMLIEIQNEMQGYQAGIKKLISDSKNDAGLSSRIEGVVAQLIRVDEKFETAIETALGAALQNIVTKTEEDAKYLINYLKENRYGRATFLPMSAVRARDFDYAHKQYLTTKGSFGSAAGIIRFDNKYYDIFSNLLGRTLVVDNLDTAVDIAKRSSYSFRIVTLDGDIISPQGSISGGSRRAEISGLLGTDRELEAVVNELGQLKTRYDALSAAQDRLGKEQERLLNAQRVNTQKVNERAVIVATVSEKIAKLTTDAATQQSIKAALESAIADADVRTLEIENRIRSVDELENIISQSKQNANSSKDENVKQFNALKEQRDAYSKELTDARVELAALSSAYTALETETGRIKGDIIIIDGQLDESRAQIGVNEQTIAAAITARDSGAEAESADSLREQIDGIRQDIDKISQFKQICAQDMTALDKRRAELVALINSLNQKKFDIEKDLERLTINLETAQDRIFREYNLDFDGCLEFKDPDFVYTKGKAEITRINRDIARMGFINGNAPEDYEKVRERYGYESAHKEDMEKSIAEIRLIIADMTKVMTEMFIKAFNEIKENFSIVFRQLFGGGTADLTLEEGDDILNAGIEIEAQPPGKKLQKISLLSGGERALTAIAILFAILRRRTMPFCVLDEIEAALDDANAERFAKYLRKFSEKTQFIVITHRKPTMELADSLYGVTMEEKGVSKIVSVKLSDAIKGVAEAG